ncbi:DNA-binding protein [Oceanidesulfovibrio indonesiensis]|uniref:DNA-binding protein n=1 Tax=Oceanidesulfovibrio indonesiensis TaxID=54767 RepID=A0A7M3MK46_9BACT|nr:HD domain-containing protein [Oceanidesulfovibrio indonesiensis]TVM20060.1 DNA-binding protein [Oceanidesulfovibrio indonesiensis]
MEASRKGEPVPTHTKRQFVRDLQSGDAVTDVFAIASARSGTAKNGPFWTLHLMDATGTVEAKIWSPLSQQFPSIDPGRLVLVEARAGTYRDSVQLSLDRLTFVEAVLGEDDLPEQTAEGEIALRVDFSEFMPSAPQKPEDMMHKLEELCRQNLHYPPWRRLMKKILNDPEIRHRFMYSPGAKAMHHAYLGGLLEHTLSVCGLCVKFADQYPHLDREILFAAAILHDLGKAWELSGGLANDYTDAGRLMGHIQIGLERIAPFLADSGLPDHLVLHLKHIILSHHGEYEYGSPKRPKTAEAFALHYADNMDAKMNQVANALAPLEEAAPQPENGDESPAEVTGWSAFQRGLDRFLFKARPTPGASIPVNREKTNKENQCSLPLKG